jgi:hypothetical protein
LKAVAEVVQEQTVQVGMVALELLLTSLEHLPNTAAAEHLWATQALHLNMEPQQAVEEFLPHTAQMLKGMQQLIPVAVAAEITE